MGGLEQRRRQTRVFNRRLLSPGPGPPYFSRLEVRETIKLGSHLTDAVEPMDFSISSRAC